MARLTIEQVRAPDFSASSEMLARAAESFNTGIESAKGILGKYNEGQQAKGDQALLGALAGLSSEEELESFLQNTDLASMNISDTMRQNILGARGVILGNDSTRQSVVNARDSNSRANAGESRVAAEYADGVAARDEMRALTPAYVSALTEAQQYGRGASTAPGETPSWIRYENQNATRNDPLNPALVDSMSFLGEMGIEMRVVSGGQEAEGEGGERTGSTRHDHGNAADVDFYMGGRRLSTENPDDIPILTQIVQQARANGVTGFGEGADYMGAGRVHIGFGPESVWGAGGSSENAPEWLRAAVGGAPLGSPRTSTTPVTSNPMGGQAAAEFAAALQAGTRLTPDQASQLFNSVLDQQAGGQSLIDTVEAARQAELSAEATRAAILDPNNLSQTDVQRDLLSTPGLSFGNQLTTAGQDLSTYAGVIAPAVSPDAEVNAALERTRAADAAAAGQDPLSRSFELAQTFGAAEDVGGALLSEFEVPEGSGYDAEYVNRRITQLADDAGVTPAEMAATLSNVSQGNFQQFEAMFNAASDTDMYRTVLDLAKRDFSEENRDIYDRTQRESVSREAQRSAAELELTTARSRALKLPEGSPEREAADREVAALRDTLVAGRTPQERQQGLRDYISQTGMASRLQGLDPNSTEFNQAMLQLEEYIKVDPTLTDTEKELLLADIRG